MAIIGSSIIIPVDEMIVDALLDANSTNPVQNKVVKGAIDNKVDKVSGKGLSKNDYTDADKEKVDGAIQFTEKGNASGVAELDENGHVPSSQLPSYVDDVLEGYMYNGTFYEDEEHTHAVTPESGKVYIDLATNLSYRWGGSVYVKIASDLALGETSGTAYRGDRGKTAYDDSQTNKTHIGTMGNLTTTEKNTLVGAVNELNAGKVDKVQGKGLSTEDYTTAEKEKLANLDANDVAYSSSGSYAAGTVGAGIQEASSKAGAARSYTMAVSVGAVFYNPSAVSGAQLSPNQITVNLFKDVIGVREAATASYYAYTVSFNDVGHTEVVSKLPNGASTDTYTLPSSIDGDGYVRVQALGSSYNVLAEAKIPIIAKTEIDTTLTKEGAAADAKATGDALSEALTDGDMSIATEEQIACLFYRSASAILSALNQNKDLSGMVGQQIACTKGNGTLLWDIVDYDSTYGEVTLMLHYVISAATDICLEPAQAMGYFASGLEAGSYRVTAPSSYTEEYLYFTLTSDLPEGGQLVLDDSSGESQAVIMSYASADSITPIETVNVTYEAISGATDLGSFGTGNLNNYDRCIDGSGNIKESRILAWLNSDYEVPSVDPGDDSGITKTNKFSRPPASFSWQVDGFMADIDPNFLNALATTTWKCAANTVYEAPPECGGTVLKNSAYTMNSVFNLPSYKEVFGTTYGIEASDTVFNAFDGAEDDDRVKYFDLDHSIAMPWLLRTPDPNRPGYVTAVHAGGSDHTSGSVPQPYSGSAKYIAPVCKIRKTV